MIWTAVLRGWANSALAIWLVPLCLSSSSVSGGSLSADAGSFTPKIKTHLLASKWEHTPDQESRAHHP